MHLKEAPLLQQRGMCHATCRAANCRGGCVSRVGIRERHRAALLPIEGLQKLKEIGHRDHAPGSRDPFTASPAAASGRIVPTPASDGGADAFRAAPRNERHPAPGTTAGATAGSATGCAPAGCVAAGASASAPGGGTRACAASWSTPSGSTADGRTPFRGNRRDAEGEDGRRVRRHFTGPNELQQQLSYHGDNVDASLLERQSLARLRLGVAREMVGLLKGPMNAARKAAVQA